MSMPPDIAIRAQLGAFLGAAGVKIREANDEQVIRLAAGLFKIDAAGHTMSSMSAAVDALGKQIRRGHCRTYRAVNGIPHPNRPVRKPVVVFRAPPAKPVPAPAKPLRRARIKPGQSFYDTDEWREVRYRALVIHGGCCQCCGASPFRGNPLHVDHIKPRSKFPELELDLNNLQVLCKDCNLGKRAWDQTDWRPRTEAAE